jgi:hypothetical protein
MVVDDELPRADRVAELRKQAELVGGVRSVLGAKYRE